MVIFQVVNVRWFNATAWYALYLSRLLHESGHRVVVLTQAGTESHKKAVQWGLDARPVDLNTANPLRLAVTLWKLVRLLKTEKPQIVNCHRGEGFFLWGLLKALGFGFRLVRTRGDQRPPHADVLNRFLHAHVADAVVVTNSLHQLKQLADGSRIEFAVKAQATGAVLAVVTVDVPKMELPAATTEPAKGGVK